MQADSEHPRAFQHRRHAIDADEGRTDPASLFGTRLGRERASSSSTTRGIPAEQLQEVFAFRQHRGFAAPIKPPVSRKILREHGGDLLVQPTRV